VDGHCTVAAWARANGNWSTSRSKRLVQLAAVLHAADEVRTAAHRGQLGIDQLRRIAEVYANRRARDHFAGSARLLVDHAQSLRFSDFHIFCARWEAYADRDGAHKDHDRAHEGRFAMVRLVGEQVLVHAEGGVLAGTYLRGVHEAFCQAEFQADWAEGVAKYGDSMCAELLERTGAQRSFDALLKIFQAAEGSGVLGEIRPVVNVIVDQGTFEAELARAAGAEPEPIDPATVDHRRCETPDGVQIDPAQMLSAALIGHVRRVVLDSAGVVIDFGRKRRLFTGAAREALLLFGPRTCIHPGCNRPARQSEADHATPWCEGGGTDQTNGTIECNVHNPFKNNGFRTWRDTDGRWHTIRPDGREVGRLEPPDTS
jgi:hypothetical protein